jgi:NADPH2:quinone reductase
MKAIRVREFGGPEVLKIEDIPDPKAGPGQVVVAVRAAGVNPVETYIRSGVYHLKPDIPYTPGWESAGTVESVGEGVVSVKVGDRVYTSGSLSGTYAEKTLCAEGTVHPLPDRVSFEQGAGIDVAYATSYHALFQRARALPGETVFINGASGGVGIAAVQLARNAGMTVIGTGGTEKGRALALEQGAHYVLDHRAPDYYQKLMDLTCGRGADVILEMLANVNLAKDLTAVARDGRIVIIGSRGTIEINPRDAMVRRAQIMGVLLFLATDEEKKSLRAAIHAGLENGTLSPVVGRKFPLSEAAKAHVQVMEPGAYGKIVLIP